MRTSRLAIVALLCLVGFAGIAVVAGAPPPTHLCGVCGSEWADEPGLEGATGPGTLDIYVDETGDSRWSARVPVTDSAAERYRTNESALEAAVDDAWVRYHAADGDIGTVERTDDGDNVVDYTAESSVDGNAVVVNYTVDDVARPGVGDAWIVDYFADGPSNVRYRLASERVTLHTPEGTAVTNRPARASVDGNTATWTRGEDGSGGFDGRTYVTYGEGGVVGTASGYATIGLEIGPPALEQGVVNGLVPGALVALAGAVAGRVGWGRSAFDSGELERLLVAVGSVGAVGLLVSSAAATGRLFTPGLGALSALGVGYASLAVVARRGGYRRSTRDSLAAVALVTLGTGVLLWLLGGPTALAALPFGLATGLFLPIGDAFERRSRSLVGVLLAVLVAVAMIAAATTLSLLLSPAGLGLLLYWFLLLGWAVTVVAFGYPLALMGGQLAGAETA